LTSVSGQQHSYTKTLVDQTSWKSNECIHG